MKKIAIAADHGGFVAKSALIAGLRAHGYEMLDLGTDSDISVDYPDFADRLADALAAGEAETGILICGTGIGVSIAANRHKHIRAALCASATDARLAREHNDANVIALGARTMGDVLIMDCVRTFLSTGFDGGDRHMRRIGKLS